MRNRQFDMRNRRYDMRRLLRRLCRPLVDTAGRDPVTLRVLGVRQQKSSLWRVSLGVGFDPTERSVGGS